MAIPSRADGGEGRAGAHLRLQTAADRLRFLWWQIQDAPDGLATGPVLAHPPGRGDPLHDEQAQPTLGAILGFQQPPQVRVLVLDGHVKMGAAQLHPQLQRRARVDHRVGDQLAGQQGRRPGQLLEPPVAAYLPHERPAGAGGSGHRLQDQPLPQPRRSIAGVSQGLVQAGIHRQTPCHPVPDEEVRHRRPGAGQHQGGARPAERRVPDRGEHLGAQRVDRLHLAKVADDRRWLLGQLLEDGPLDLWSGREVEPARQGQHDAPLTAGLLDPHRGLHLHRSPRQASYAGAPLPGRPAISSDEDEAAVQLSSKAGRTASVMRRIPCQRSTSTTCPTGAAAT